MSGGLYLPETNVGEILMALNADLDNSRPIAVLDLIQQVAGLPDYLSGDLA